MKLIIPYLLLACAGISESQGLSAQCAGNTAALTIRYDTTVMGNGNSSRMFTIPKFNPSTGTLLSVDIASVVHLSYAYSLQNQDTASHTYRTKIIRTDDIYSSALDPGSIDTVNQTPPVMSPLLAPMQTLYYGPAFMKYTLSSSITDNRMTNFLGQGTNAFDYETGTSASVQGPLPYGLNFASATDTTLFSVTYRYCATSLLSADLLFFSAAVQAGNQVLLNWRQAAVDPNRFYNVEVSPDGRTYQALGDIIENRDGNYAFTYAGGANGTLFFRIRENNVSGAVKYSNIRLISFDAAAVNKMKVYPSLLSGGDVHVVLPLKGAWQLSLFSLDGRRITEAKVVDSFTGLLSLPTGLGNGIYLVQAVEALSGNRQVGRIIIRH